jgi:hypothetical protein
MESECPSCDVEKELTATILVHDASVFGHPTRKGITNMDVSFDVSFPGDADSVDDGYTSIPICNSCYKSSEHLTETAKADL